MAEIMRVRRIDLDRGEVCLAPETVLCQGCSGDHCAHGGTRTLRALHEEGSNLRVGDRVEVVAPRGAIARALLRLVGVPAALAGVGVLLVAGGVLLVGAIAAAVTGAVLGLVLTVLRGSRRRDLLQVRRRIPPVSAAVIGPEAVVSRDIRTDG